MKQIVTRNSKALQYWLGLGAVLYISSHIPEIRFTHLATISPFQAYQLLTGILAIYMFVVNLKFREHTLHIIHRYRKLVLAGVVLIAYVFFTIVFSGIFDNFWSSLLLFTGMGFSAAIVSLATFSELKISWLENVIVWAGIALGLFSIWQFIGDNLGAPLWMTQILGTTTWTQIDFSRANGLSAEPQFMTTILLLPAAILSYRFLSDKHMNRALYASIFLIDTAVFLSLSRGGFLAHGLLAGLLLIYALITWQMKIAFSRLIIGLSALAFTLLLVAWSGTLPGHQDPKWVSYRYIEQATGGLIPLHTEYVLENQEVLIVDNPDLKLDQPIPPSGQRDDVGVVNESTLGRVQFMQTAFKLWTKDLFSFVFGIGWGNFGDRASDVYGGPYTPKAITNNQPAQIAVELGLVGVAMSLYFVYRLILVIRGIRHSDRRLIAMGLLLAIAVQLQFYSALHLSLIWYAIAIVFLWSYSDNKGLRAKVMP